MIVILITIGLTISVTSILLMHISKPVYHPGNHGAPTDQSKPRILLVFLPNSCLGGAEAHFVMLHKMLLTNGYHATALVVHGSQLQKQLEKEHLPFYTTHAKAFANTFRPLFHLLLTWHLRTICTKEHIDIIHCNAIIELKDIIKVAKSTSRKVKVVYTHHVSGIFPTKKMRGTSATVAVNPSVTSYIESENQINNLSINIIRYIPPFFNAERFLTFSTQQTRTDFFKKNFNIDLANLPVICTIANFYENDIQKNHRLLLQAVHILVHTKKKPAHFMLAGNINHAKPFIELAQHLAIDQYVYFLGFTDQIPALLYHSDIMVLPSRFEGCPLAILETGTMKKPAIGAQDSGSDTALIHEKTGLLFKNNDADDLAYQMGRLLDNPSWTQELGQNAYQHVLQNFGPEVTFARHAALYQELVSHAQPK